ncbi:topoisomerase II [Verticillium alfalfae VaMs.102]|uniref:Topoisomerase II n=1 Tax=Verticillium alfalfae (strain VaMs.102 / ATCC MYA-4576 / FGSC 10136) TaxID=526221 RepID=C9SFW8_VERA1|nr:topoisomerase II [Verticillium alfalfae VaMs.102]EEY17372.1 topoisomerase II [Verticillium alfalfae VaMs.102]
MSFFGFDATRHNNAAPGFSQAHDPFAGFVTNFDESGRCLSTTIPFGRRALRDSGPNNRGGAPSVWQGFRLFFGQIAKCRMPLSRNNSFFSRQGLEPREPQAPENKFVCHCFLVSTTLASPVNLTAPPARTGYEKYREAEPIPDLHVDASLWGMPAKKFAPTPSPQPAYQPSSVPASGRKVMSLEEVEKAMREQTTVPGQHAGVENVHHPQHYAADHSDFYGHPEHAQHQYSYSAAEQQRATHSPAHPGHSHPVTILQRPQSKQPTPSAPSPQARQQQQQPPPVHPTQILQNPNRLSGSDQAQAQAQQQHLAHLSEEEKAAFLDQETKRAKRNHKIWLLSKDNGLMTPQDKNFITRIQLQQLVSATGNPTDVANEGALAEDFYYQVLSQIRGGQRQNPNQPLNNFAQTYLFQTGSRQGAMRRQGRAAENHVQRMEQQVQRAVEAAKNKPKNPQLVIAGSLGKISFSNSKTPKPLLNIKRTESSGETQKPSNAKRALGGGALDQQAQALNAKLWSELKVHEPIREGTVHPFIAFLSFPKGKKVFSRVFRHISFEQRTTILTMIIFHLDSLDVVHGAQLTHGEKNLSAQKREDIELFSLAVMPSLFAYFNDTQIDIVTDVLSIITSKLNVDSIAKTRVGTSMLTLVLSRAELLKQAGGGNPQAWNEWDQVFGSFFNVIEPTLPHMFPGNVNAGEDVIVWQLLAAMGVSANPEQQQRLVLAVKDRVLSTVEHAKTLPGAMASQRLGTVNLFMHSIGLDVDLLQ